MIRLEAHLSRRGGEPDALGWRAACCPCIGRTPVSTTQKERAVSGGRNTLGHDLVKRWGWLDPLANFFGAIVGGFYKLPGTHPLKDLLHGTWPLHHPLHPAVTDLTIGGETPLGALDVLYVVTDQPRLLPAPGFVLLRSLFPSLGSIRPRFTPLNQTYHTQR